MQRVGECGAVTTKMSHGLCSALLWCEVTEVAEGSTDTVLVQMQWARVEPQVSRTPGPSAYHYTKRTLWSEGHLLRVRQGYFLGELISKSVRKALCRVCVIACPYSHLESKASLSLSPRLTHGSVLHLCSDRGRETGRLDWGRVGLTRFPLHQHRSAVSTATRLSALHKPSQGMPRGFQLGGCFVFHHFPL